MPKRENYLTIEFQDHFVIKPTIKFIDQKIDYLVNNKKEKGKLVKENFEYNSGNNDNFLKVNEIRKYLKTI